MYSSVSIRTYSTKVFVYYLCAISTLCCQLKLFKCDKWEYKLTHDLLEGYDSSIRPSIHHNATLNVTFGLALTQIIDVDERNMIITTNCWLNQNWIDEKLKWDPSNYDGIEFIHIPTEKLWKPDILLVNNADIWAKSSSISTNAIVKNNGNITWLSTVIFKSSCTINVRYFPFDEQSCDMIFASWTFDGFFLDINVNSVDGDITNYIKNGEWHLVRLNATKNIKTYSCCEEPYPEIIYQFHIRRRPLYYVFNMVFPCLLITLVAFLGFYLPPGCSEKVSIGITTLLSITVFLMLVAESMPPTSEQLPLLGIYYAVTIGIVSISTSFAVITLNINNKGNKGKKVPRLLKVIFIDYLAKILRTELSSSLKTRENKKKNSLRNSLLKNSLLIATNDLTSRKFKYQSALMSTHGHLAATQEKRAAHMSKPMPSLALNEQTSSSTSANSLYQYSSTQESAFRTYSLNLSKENTAACIHQNDDSYIQYIDNDDSIVENLCDLEERKNAAKKSVNFDQIVLKADLKQQTTPTNPHIHCMCECSNNSISFADNQSSVGNGNFAVNKRRKYSVPVDPRPHNNEEPDKIKRLDKHFKNCLMNVMGKKREPCVSANDGDSHLIGKEFTMELKALLESQFDPLIKSLLATIDKSEKRLQEKEKLEQIQNDWGDVAKVADHFLCFFFPTITIATCFVIFFNSPHVFSGW